jgi:hypothetical protein
VSIVIVIAAITCIAVIIVAWLACENSFVFIPYILFNVLVLGIVWDPILLRILHCIFLSVFVHVRQPCRITVSFIFIHIHIPIPIPIIIIIIIIISCCVGLILLMSYFECLNSFYSIVLFVILLPIPLLMVVVAEGEIALFALFWLHHLRLLMLQCVLF